MKKQKKGALVYLTAGLAVLLLCAIAVIIVLLTGQGESAAPEEKETGTVERAEGVIHLPGYASLHLKAGSEEQTLALANPAENTVVIRISLQLADGTLLWQSEELKPGETSEPIRLSKALEVGEYPGALLKYECFTNDKEKTPKNGAESELTLIVG